MFKWSAAFEAPAENLSVPNKRLRILVKVSRHRAAAPNIGLAVPAPNVPSFLTQNGSYKLVTQTK